MLSFFKKTYRRIEALGENKAVLWSVMALYTVLLCVCSYYHEAWWDEYHAWNVVYHHSFTELIAFMRYEGHFCLWHLLLYPFIKWGGMDWRCLNLVSVPLMLVAAGLLLHKVRFPFTGKLLIMFSAPFAFYFPVVARCYALIPPVMLGIVALYQKREKPFLYCFLIGLLAHTHAYIEGLVAVLWCIFVYDHVWLLRKTDPRRAVRNAWAASLTIVMVLLALAQVVQGFFDVAHGHEPIGLGKDTPYVWLQRFYLGYNIYFLDVLHKNVWHYLPRVDFLLTLISYAAVLILTFKVLTLCREGWVRPALLLLCGIGWQVLFAFNIYGMHYQRIYLLWFVLVMMFLMYGVDSRQTKYVLACLFVLWMLNTHSQRSWMEHFFTATADRTDATLAAHIHDNVPKQSTLYIASDATRILPHALMHDWSRYSIREVMRMQQQDIVDYYLVMNAGREPDLPEDFASEIIFQDRNYTLYHITRGELNSD